MSDLHKTKERIQLIDIDSSECIRCYACCDGGCAGAPSIFVQPNLADSIPALRCPRDGWVEEEVLDAVFGCPTMAISVTYQTYQLTGEGKRHIGE